MRTLVCYRKAVNPAKREDANDSCCEIPFPPAKALEVPLCGKAHSPLGVSRAIRRKRSADQPRQTSVRMADDSPGALQRVARFASTFILASGQNIGKHMATNEDKCRVTLSCC